jgi:hypothetical protein
VAQRTRYELGLGARMSSGQHEKDPRGAISLVERGALLSARLTYRAGRLEVGGALQLYVAFITAEGFINGQGVRDRKPVVSAILSLGPDLRVRLFRLVYLRFAPSLDLATTDQRFSIDGDVLIDRRFVGASLPLSLVISLPIKPTGEGFQP